MIRERLSITLLTLTRVCYYRAIGNKHKMSQALFEGFNRLGGVYVKFLQVLALQSDFFTSLSSNERWQVFEDVTPQELDIQGFVSKELGPEKSQLIRLSEAEAFAAGSFGQVYRAQLADGTDVIIKALRPSLKQYLSLDLKLLEVVARFVNITKVDSMFDTKQLFRDFKTVTISETDYLKEARAGVELYEHYKDHHYVHIPKTFLELSTPLMIVQEYVGGISATQLLAQKEAGVDIRQYVREQLDSDLDFQLSALGIEMLYAVFDSSSTQCDPHPGNIKLLPNNRVALIDFGIMAPAPADLNSFLDLTREYAHYYTTHELDIERVTAALLNMYVPDLIRAIKTVSNLQSPEQQIDVTAEIGRIAKELFLDSHNRAKLQELTSGNRLMKIFVEVINEGNRFGFKMHYDATTVLRGTQTFMKMMGSFGCDREIIAIIFNTVVERVETELGKFFPVQQSVKTIDDALAIIADWLERVMTNDPVLYRKLSALVESKGYA